MKHHNWKLWIFKKAEALIKGATTPLPIKELAFQAINFAVKCGQSNPVSYAIRPLLVHQHLRLVVGLNLALMAILVALMSPTPTMAENTGGPVSITVVSEGETNLVTIKGVTSPLPELKVTQRFWLLHSGIDLGIEIGTPVHPIMKGKVSRVEKSWIGYGNMIVITHGQEFESLYAHLSKINVNEGDEVSINTVIGLSGSTGRSTGPHLHLEIHQDGKAINPAPILGL